MHDIDSVKKRIITSMIAILLLIFALFGITYAYFTAKVKGNTNDKSVDVSAGKLELVYGDGNGFIKVDKIQPGEVIKSKTFTVKNTGTGDIDSYEVILENVINELKYYNDLTYELECNSDIGTCNGTNNTFPIYDDVLLTNSIKVGETHSYTLTLTYHETNVDQSDDMNKNIEAKVNIIDSEENYRKINVYGNTLLTYQDGETEVSRDKPGIIKSLGTKVTDTNDANYGKYKVNISTIGKNLANFKIFNGKNNLTVSDNGVVKMPLVTSGNGYYETSVKLKDLCPTLKVGDVVVLSFTSNTDTNKFIYLGTSKILWRVDKSITITENDLNSYVVLYGNRYESNDTVQKTISNFQIEYGEKSTSYEKYTEKKDFTIYLNEPLRCIGNTCDYIDLMTNKVVRNIKEYIFTGEENFNLFPNTNNFFITNLEDAKYEPNISCVSNMYNCNNSGGGTSYTSGMWFQSVDKYKRLYIADSNYTAAATFKNSIKELYKNNNLLIVDYILEMSNDSEVINFVNYKLLSNKTLEVSDGELSSSKIEME